MIRSIKLLSLMSLPPLAACVQPPPAFSGQTAQWSAPQCFRAHEITRYNPGPDGVVTVQATAGRWYSMQLSSECPSIDWLMQISIRPKDSYWLCERQNSYLIAPDPAGMHPLCLISGIQQLPPPPLAARVVREEKRGRS